MPEGYRSPKYGSRGVYFLSTGPSGPRPGGAVHIVIYGPDGTILRQLKQEELSVIDDGYIHFFQELARPRRAIYGIVEYDAAGTRTVLQSAEGGQAGGDWLHANFDRWVETYAPAPFM